ncbi:MAG: hypothetical protein ACREMX_18480, partial [Gemmatimonadales bacterium]
LTLGCDGKTAGPSGSTSPIDPVGAKPGDVCLDPSGNPLPIRPDSERVDLTPPSFSNPTNVTNPLFPIGGLFRVLLLGNVEGVPLRVETTLLADTRTLDLGDQSVETLVSQYVAFLGGRIHEVALDFYGQADDGAAWYFGEDVFNYEDGLVADTEGTWLAGREGPPAMIMPANPQAGDVYRPENICGIVFEEVVVKSTGVTVDGPRGPVTGAMVARELHMDATLEDKTFAPGYGEFSSGAGSDLEAVALAIPIDALPGLPPKELETLSSGAAEIFDAAQAEDWEAASAAAGGMTEAWDAFTGGEVPPRLEAQMDGALESLVATVESQDPAEARQAALDVSLAGLDLKHRHRTAAETDLDLLEHWARQLVVDAEAGDRSAVIGDAATLRWIRDRVARDVSLAELNSIDSRISALQAAARSGDLRQAASAAGSLRSAVARVHVTARRR